MYRQSKATQRTRKLIAIFSVSAFLMLGASPALAEEPPGDPAVPLAPVEPVPAPEPPPADPAPVEPAPVDPAPVDPVPTAPEVPAAPSTPPAADQAGTPAPLVAPETSLLAESPSVPEPPYVRWRVTDEAGALVAGTTIEVQGPRNDGVADDGADSQWASAVSGKVADNTGDPAYAGADLDPIAGQFLVKQITDELNPSVVHEVTPGEGIRVRPAVAPSGYQTDRAAWLTLTVAGSPDDRVDALVLRTSEQSSLRAAAEPQSDLIAPMAIIAADCGNTTSCAELRLTTVVNGGGPATAASWALKAVRNNATADEYQLTSGVSRTVPNGSTYVLSGVADPAIQQQYVASLTCPAGSLAPTSGSTGNRTTFNSAAQSVTFGSTGSLLPTARYARCTLTQTYAGTTTVHITKIGDRTGTGLTAGSPVPGATFSAFASTAGTSGVPTGPALGSCVTNAAGVCDIVVPNTYTNGIWVQETGSPAGWLPISALGTGNYNSPKTITPYQFRVAVGATGSNVTRNVTADANLPNTDVSGAWVNARVNPPFPESCGVKIAMVFDTSASINSSEMTSFKTAASNFLGNTALGGTPSTVSMFRFDTVAQTMNGGASYDLAIPGSALSNSGYLGAQNQVNTGLPSSGSGYTNWDSALRLVGSSGPFDMVLMLTDGDPTTYGNGTTTDLDVQFRMVEQAVMSANAVKAQIGPSGSKTKIVGIGVGLSTNSDLNLKAITGSAQGDDYFLSSDFAALQATLQEIALKNCASTLTVIKQVQDSEGNVISANTAGWQFTASGDVVVGSPATQVTTASGTNFALSFDDQATHTVSVQEQPQVGYTYFGTTCTNAAGSVTNVTDGFTVPVKVGLITSCTVVNRQVPPAAALTLVKELNIQFGGTSVVGDWQLTATGPTTITGATGQLPVTDAVVTPGEYRLSETGPAGYSAGDWICLDGENPVPVDDDGDVTIANGANVVCTIENSDLPGAVIWSKTASVGGGLLGGSEWKIVGPAPSVTEVAIIDCISAPCLEPDTDPVSGQFKLEGLSWGSYTVTETKAPPGYIGGASFDFIVTGANAGAVPIDKGAITNDQQPGVALPLTGGWGADTFTLLGGGIAALALILGVAYWRRLRRIPEVM